jgi:pimeloyl-ACP methyl ester carboxylesterase
MSTLPDINRPRLPQPAVSSLKMFRRLVRSATWRALHPSTRGRFLEAEKPGLLRRLYYTASDDWQAPVFYVPPAPGGAGEPVLLAHALGVGCDGFRYGVGATLAGRLASAGFAVYLLGHRGDRCAIPPSSRALREATFDEILDRDLPAAVDVVCAHAGFPRVHMVGHGLGGLLAMVSASRQSCALATVVSLGAPMRFEPVRSELRRTARALSLLPAHWELPTSTLARLAAPLLDDASAGGARTRGVMEYAAEDIPVGLLRQMMTWQDQGVPTTLDGSVDYTEGLARADVPLLVFAGTEDALVNPRDALPPWAHEDVRMEVLDGLGHLDLLLSVQARRAVFDPLCAWLEHRRRLVWEKDGELRAS